MSGFSTLTVEDLPDRIVVTLSRPAARNAINSQMVLELHRVCELAERRPRPLAITGSGGFFAAGADIGELRDRDREDALAGINRSLFDRIAHLPQPTVAAVDGPALGGGAELAYACDLRLASTSAVFASPETGLGIIAAAGAGWRLGELVGKSVARQVLLGGARLDASRALQLGLVMEVVAPAELLARTHAVIDRMTLAAPLALRLTKLVVDSTAHPVADDLAQAILFESEEKKERMQAFLDRGR